MRGSLPRPRRGDNHPIAGDSEQTTAQGSRKGLLRALGTSADWLAPAENPSRVVLGVIVTGALLAAESGLHDNYLETFASGALAALLYWLAHAYADVLGRRLRSSRRLTARELGESLLHEGAVIRGAAIPLLALLIAAILGADRETGVSIAIWTAAGSIVVLELIAGLRSHATRGEILLEAAVGITMGLGVIALKALLAH
jgi:hypothetical protein